jgi:hypothetical protein
MRFRRLITCLLTLATFAITATAAQACTETWTGNAGDGSWNTANNWSPAQVPQTTDAVCDGGLSLGCFDHTPAR